MKTLPPNWCDGAVDFWKGVEPSVNGMLGGFEQLAGADVAASEQFLLSILKPVQEEGLALDVGAGIGRVSRDLLLPHFAKVALLECNKEFIDVALKSIPRKSVYKVFPTAIQDFVAAGEDFGRFDLVWVQWVIIYANDEGLVSFLREAVKLLRHNGLICIKDNVLLPGSKLPARVGRHPMPGKKLSQDLLLDEQDHSVTRSERYLLDLTAAAGLELVARQPQSDFPNGIFPVVMYAFKPKVAH